MYKLQKSLLILLALLAFGPTAWAWSGSGTSSDPYLITSTADWNTLATNVNAGTSYSGKFFKLTANITVSEMVGTNSNRFSGTFDGDGHTLTFNKGASNNRFSEQHCGPFRYIKNATFKRLHVAGTIYTSNQFAGVVGRTDGTNYFNSCHSSLIIDCSKSGDGTHGGFIGVVEGTWTYFTNCLFDGQLLGSSSESNGGFCGWSQNGVTFTNCLFAPASVTFSTNDSKTFSRGYNVSLTKAYYKQTFGDDQGATNASGMSDDALVAALGAGWEVRDNKVVPVMSLRTWSSGEGTQESPYQIANATDWDNLAFNVSVFGVSYSGNYFKMTANITVSDMVGTDANPFKGTFDGGGHILNLNITDQTNQGTAPFRYISGATIRFVKTTGTVNGAMHCSGLVGFAKDGSTNFIRNCEVAVTVNCGGTGSHTHCGGVLGHGKNSNTTIVNCLFSGSISGATDTVGVIYGWGDNGTHTIENCLSTGTCNSASTTCLIAERGTHNIINCYRTTSNVSQGNSANGMTNETLVAALGNGWQISGGKVVPLIQIKTLTGSGTTESPYLIASATDWNNFTFNVSVFGETYSGNYFKMTADIEVSEMVGTDGNRFSGIFNGDGHTLTFNKGTADNRFGEGYCAPFRYINGATFKRLHVAGTIYTSNQFAGMVGHAKGTNNFQSCHSSLTINSSITGENPDGTHGGFIANNNQTSCLTNCLFDGSFISTNTTNCGGFIGWTGSGHAYFTNCLFAPTNIDFTNASTCKTFARYNNSNADYTKCYYKQTFGTVDGGTNASSMSNADLKAALGGMWEISGGKVVPIMQAQALIGSGTAGSPYLIASTDDWNKLAFNVSYCEEPYNGEYFQLTADITITSTVGAENCPFGGTFNGDGHVFHLNIKDVGTSGTAPFRYIKNATIQYIKTDGLLVGGMHCSGLVGFAKGTNTIQGCEVAAEVYCSANNTHCGGILGHGLSSNTTIQDCLFSGVLDGATNTTGIIFGWGDAGSHTIINSLSSGDCAGGTVKLIAGNGTKTITNSYHTTAGPTDGTDASDMSRDALQTALGAGWGTRGSHVVPVRFAETATPQPGAAMVDLESDYVPTQIINGNFGVRPWMSYRYDGTDYTSYDGSASVANNTIIEASYPNGVNGGWNTTENKIFDRGLFEYMHSVYNDYIPNYGGCVEMNAENSAVLWQDLTTHANDVIRWSLLHAVRTNYGPDVQSMRVEVGSPEYSSGNIVPATGINEAVDSKITAASKATYNPSGYSGTYAKGADNLAKLALSKTDNEDKSAWHQVRGIYRIPEGQTVTRFAFISTSADKLSAGNYLDKLAFSTLIGNLSAVQLNNGDVILRGYWGETDANKHLVVTTNSKTSSNIDMSSVANENFKITIPAATMGEATSLSVYHEDYPDAGRSISITPSYKLSITHYTSDDTSDGWYLIASPIGTVSPSSVINMTNNTFDIFRFNQNPVENGGNYLEWENWEEPNSGSINHYHFNLEPGRGYLYANSEDVTLNFVGTPNDGDGVVDLEYSTTNPDSRMHGWNLIGNPFGTAATVDKASYKMNDYHNGFVSQVENASVGAMEGVFVQAADENQKATFTAQTRGSKQATIARTNIMISGDNGKVLDNAIIRFDEGETLGKFQLRDNSTKVYIPVEGKEYAIAKADNQSEMPLNFKAEKNGNYTLSFSDENIEFGYMHLIDNMTGADIDLLQTPSYTFTAKTTDYESRFKLVYSASQNDNENENENFAFIGSNGQLIVNGTGTIQIIDIMGRVIVAKSTEERISTNGMTAGVYVLQLITGTETKTQKIIVK